MCFWEVFCFRSRSFLPPHSLYTSVPIFPRPVTHPKLFSKRTKPSFTATLCFVNWYEEASGYYLPDHKHPTLTSPTLYKTSVDSLQRGQGQYSSSMFGGTRSSLLACTDFQPISNQFRPIFGEWLVWLVLPAKNISKENWLDNRLCHYLATNQYDKQAIYVR